MVVLVVSSGLMIFGCDAVFVKSSSLGVGAGRLTMDGQWLRDGATVMHMRLQRCDTRDILILSRAWNQANPARTSLELSGFVFRPGDLNLDGSVTPADFTQYLSMPYDYNLDGWMDSRDFMDVIAAIGDGGLCE